MVVEGKRLLLCISREQIALLAHEGERPPHCEGCNKTYRLKVLANNNDRVFQIEHPVRMLMLTFIARSLTCPHHGSQNSIGFRPGTPLVKATDNATKDVEETSAVKMFFFFVLCCSAFHSEVVCLFLPSLSPRPVCGENHCDKWHKPARHTHTTLRTMFLNGIY